MSRICHGRRLCRRGLGFALLALCGCQTWMAGMTLPSPRYLQHPPQYIPLSPPFPLPRELSAQEASAVAPAVGAPPAVPLPPPIPQAAPGRAPAPGQPPAVPPGT